MLMMFKVAMDLQW